MSDDTAPSPGDILYVETSCDDATATIILVGEFDMTGTAHFWASVSETLTDTVRHRSLSRPAA